MKIVMTTEYLPRSKDCSFPNLTSYLSEDKISLQKDVYAWNGVKECWIVDPKEKTIGVMTLDEAGFEIATMSYQEQDEECSGS